MSLNSTDILTELKPIYRLIEEGKETLPDHFKKNVVKNGVVQEATEKGVVKMSIVALPPEDEKSALGKFWNKIKWLVKRTKEEKLPPVPVATEPKLSSDEFKPGHHVQLMGHMPYVVMENGTQYGISVEIPAGITGEWEQFDEPANELGGLIKSVTKREIGQRRKSLAVVFRTNDREPLIRRDLWTTKFSSFQEILTGGFSPVEGAEGREQFTLRERVTVEKPRIQPLAVGEEQKAVSTKEKLIFTSLGENIGVGTVDDKSWKIEVVVFEVIERQVSEIIETPLPILETSFRVGDTLRMGGGLRSFWGGGGFSAWTTSFGKPKSEKVNISGVIVQKPLAAFQVVLVGEMDNKEMGMATKTEA